MENPSWKGPIRVVHVTLGLEMGGQEKLLVEFARHADRRRFDLRFISLGQGGVLAADIEACGWPVLHLNVPSKFRPGLVLRLAGLLRRWQTDVVHSHEDRPLIHAAPAARLADVQTVIHTRHGQSPCLTRRQMTLINLAARCTDRFVGVSRDSARLTVQHGVSPKKVTTIWNGIDLDRYPYSGPCPEGPVVCVARLSPEKGIDMLIRAAALVVRENPAFILEIAGDGTCLSALRGLVDELDLANHVHFLGQVRDVSRLLARTSLFVLPSLSEGISLTILEAMARGLPVVTTRVGGNIEAVVEGETGLLVPPGDPGELAAAICRLQRDPEQGRALGRAGRARVEDHFDVRRMVAAYEALYLTCGRMSAATRAKLAEPSGVPVASSM